jgi:hypothetical protein
MSNVEDYEAIIGVISAIEETDAKYSQYAC